ncbi:MAG: efflux RND transporter periplasmic adaptor subunit [Halarsenatibacteraceae bacterium]
MKKKLLLSISIIILTLLSLSGTVVTAETEILRATGLIQPVIQIEISPEISGKIENINYQVGDRIKEEPLFTIFNQTARKELKLAEESLADAKLRFAQEEERLLQARINQELANIQLQEAETENLRIPELELEQSRLELESERVEFNRLENLYSRDALEEASFDQGRFKFELAELAVELSQARLEDTKDNIAQRKKETSLNYDEAEKAVVLAELSVQSAEKAVNQAELDYELAELRLDNYSISGPEGYLIIAKEFTEGEYISPGQTVFTIIKPEFEILIEPDERELSQLSPGLEGSAVVESRPDQPFEIVIDRINPLVDPDRGTIEVYLSIEGETPELFPYMAVSIEFVLDGE